MVAADPSRPRAGPDVPCVVCSAAGGLGFLARSACSATAVVYPRSPRRVARHLGARLPSGPMPWCCCTASESAQPGRAQVTRGSRGGVCVVSVIHGDHYGPERLSVFGVVVGVCDPLQRIARIDDGGQFT